MMTIAELRDEHPDLFYPQDWFIEEEFVHQKPSPQLVSFPAVLKPAPNEPATEPTIRAVDLLNLYVRTPGHPMWHYFLWCADTDRFGQRIYIGGTNVGRVPGMQIHRHLTLTEAWVIPTWL